MIIDLSDILRFDTLSAEEYRLTMVPLREALRKEAAKTSYFPYRNLTIREMESILKNARGGTLPFTYSPEEIACHYDVDSPRDFVEWAHFADHAVDLEYASISLFPFLLNPFKEKDDDWLWSIRLMGHPGDPVSLGKSALNLQKAGVNFYLVDAVNVLKRFNKDVGYTYRSLRLQEKKSNKDQEP